MDENIDLSVFDERYNNDVTVAVAIHPKILLKVILLAYAKGMISSRQIERACHENIIFMRSLMVAPDHTHCRLCVFHAKGDLFHLQRYSHGLPRIGFAGGTHFSLDGSNSLRMSPKKSGTLAELNTSGISCRRTQAVMEEHAQADQHPQVEIERQKKRERRFQLQVERLNQFLKIANRS